MKDLSIIKDVFANQFDPQQSLKIYETIIMNSFDLYKKEISQSMETFTNLANKNKGIFIF